jgi:hypothetical protein
MAYTKTKEEQLMITRQSQIKLVLDWSVSCDKCLTLKELVSITNVMVDYIEGGYTKQIGERLDTIQDYLDHKGIESVVKKD